MPVSRFAIVAFLLVSARAGAESVVAIWWQPPGEPPLAAPAHAAFVEAVRPLGARVVEVERDAPAPSASLQPALEAAVAEYTQFHFAAAIARLDELQRLADGSGGGDLDARRLSEIFLYRGLSRLETGGAEAAWEDLVRAARLDPARVLDPARFPPRAVAAYKRAVAEVAQLPRAELELAAPPDAQLRVDGAAAQPTVSVTIGPHFVAVTAAGYEPWAGVVPVSGARERFVPALHARLPPDGDRLVALAGDAHRLVLGALVRAPSGWRFVARDVTLPDGKYVTDGVPLGDAPVRASIEALVKRLVLPPAPPPRKPRVWWPYAVAAAGVTVVALTVALGLAFGDQPSGTVGGTVK